MKRLLLMGLVVGVAATAANAATLGMQWTGTDAQKVFAAPSDTVSIDIILTVYATGPQQEAVSGVIYFNEPVPDDNLVQVGLTVDPLGQLDGMGWTWEAGGGGGILGAAGQQVALGAFAGSDVAIAPGEYVIGRQFLHVADDSPLFGEKEIVFSHNGPPPLDVLDAQGRSMKFDTAYSTSFYSTGSYGGYVAYSHWGSPGWSDKSGDGQDRIPLLLTKIPEPASLALLALGGLAALRRKR